MTNIIKERRQALGLSLQAVADAVGVNQTTIMRWEKGNLGNLKREKAELLAEVLRIDPMELMGIPREALTGVPILGRVAAGVPLLAEENVEGYADAPAAWCDGRHFALHIVGDSMETTLCDGDLVIVRRQPVAQPGSIVIAMIGSDDAVCKVLQMSDDGRVYLHPINKKYPDIYVRPTQDFRLVGVVIEARRQFKV